MPPTRYLFGLDKSLSALTEVSSAVVGGSITRRSQRRAEE